MARISEDLRLASLLDTAPQVHHHHLVGDMFLHRQIVRDEDIGEPQLLLQIHHQVQNLSPYRDIKRRYRLIGDHHIGIEHQATRNGDTLALAAGEHMWIAIVMLRLQADPRHHRQRPFAALRRRERRVDHQRLLQERADLLARIE